MTLGAKSDMPWPHTKECQQSSEVGTQDQSSKSIEQMFAKWSFFKIVMNGLVDTGEEGEGGANWESSIDVYTIFVMSDTLRLDGLQPSRLLCPWDFPGKNGVGCHALLQGTFLTQGLNMSLASSALAFRFFTTSTTWEAQYIHCFCCC